MPLPQSTFTASHRRDRPPGEPVAVPKDTIDYQHDFVASIPGDADQTKANEPKRVELYKAIAALVGACRAGQRYGSWLRRG